MSQVRKDTLPDNSQLHALVQPADFLDCYSTTASLPVREAAETALTFPGWASWLLKLRNLIVAPLGLASGPPEGSDTIGIFPIVSESEDEIIAGFDDSHLDFRISMFTKDGRTYLATWVHPHNTLGRIYLAAVMPFHILIVRNALHRVGVSINSSQQERSD